MLIDINQLCLVWDNSILAILDFDFGGIFFLKTNFSICYRLPDRTFVSPNFVGKIEEIYNSGLGFIKSFVSYRIF